MKLTKQQLENWKSLIAALESGKYTQGTHSLISNKHDNCFCIMGLACEVMGVPHVTAPVLGECFKFPDGSVGDNMPEGAWFYKNYGIDISKEFYSEYGFYALWKMNDSFDIPF